MSLARRLLMVRPRLRRTFIGTQSSTANLTSYPFDVIAPRGGLLVIGVVGRHNTLATRQFASMTFDGASQSVLNTGVASHTPGFGFGLVAPGTIAVVATFSAAIEVCAVHAWLLENVQSVTPTDSDFSLGSGTSRTATVDLPARSVGLCIHSAGNANVIDWTNATEEAASDIAVEAAIRTAAAYVEAASPVAGLGVIASGVGSNARATAAIVFN